ncbi:hypothetical protein PENANT_c020G05103 [Penicillium antarcticum]|uniref:Uncharacterized protein n=1 Tax=Penicillium antarcticum TaxID=416450 RepID=A0A1V6Q0B4_9EURO|nr:uncharacterized protein N7508_004358 [Penicillium antarcticum]KAJ5308979.1 hypothetical protein N7508_004358 [Penicillium antarcticum]OQD82718.1 hypothetical protein PENANT_c020G05103 [Penicillium antarcticum]
MASRKKVTFLDETEESKDARVGSRDISTSVYDPECLIAEEPKHNRPRPPAEDIDGVIDELIVINWEAKTLAHLDEKLSLWVKAKVPGDAIGVFLIYVLYDMDGHIISLLTNMVDGGFANFDVAWNIIFAHCSEEVASQMIMYDEACIIDPLMGRIEEEEEAEPEKTPLQYECSNCKREQQALFEGLEEQTSIKQELLTDYPIPKVVLSTMRATKVPISASEEDLHMLKMEFTAGTSNALTDFKDEQIWSDSFYDATVFQPAEANERKLEVTRLPNIETIKADIVQAGHKPNPLSPKKTNKSIPGFFSYRKVCNRLASTGLRKWAGKKDLRKEFLKGEKE